MIFVECKPDKALVSSLGARDVRHHEGKNKLLNKLRKETAAKAMVDQDPRAAQHPYLRSLQRNEEQDNIILCHDSKSRNTVILLCPDLEGWLLKTLRETGGSMEAFGMSENKYKLHKQLTVHPEKIRKVVDRIFDQSEHLKTLKQFLEVKL